MHEYKNGFVYTLAIWMMPQREPYGEWPASGEIDLMESRGMIIFYIFIWEFLNFAIFFYYAPISPTCLSQMSLY